MPVLSPIRWNVIGWFMVFYATFNNISVLSWRSVLLEYLEKTTDLLQVTGITLCCIEYTSAWTGFELTTLVGISTDCKGSCKSNYHAPTTTPDGIWGLLSCFLYIISNTLSKHFTSDDIFMEKEIVFNNTTIVKKKWEIK